MRLLVLVVAVVFSAGSLHSGASGGGGAASRSYAIRNVSCNYARDAAAKQACLSEAGTRYAVDSQRELVDEQNARQDQMIAQANQEAAAQQNGRRCESIARTLLTCQLITPSFTPQAVANCRWILNAPTGHSYGQVLCYEAAADCDGMRWCQTH